MSGRKKARQAIEKRHRHCKLVPFANPNRRSPFPPLPSLHETQSPCKYRYVCPSPTNALDSSASSPSTAALAALRPLFCPCFPSLHSPALSPSLFSAPQRRFSTSHLELRPRHVDVATLSPALARLFHSRVRRIRPRASHRTSLRAFLPAPATPHNFRVTYARKRRTESRSLQQRRTGEPATPGLSESSGQSSSELSPSLSALLTSLFQGLPFLWSAFAGCLQPLVTMASNRNYDFLVRQAAHSVSAGMVYCHAQGCCLGTQERSLANSATAPSRSSCY